MHMLVPLRRSSAGCLSQSAVPRHWSVTLIDIAGCGDWHTSGTASAGRVQAPPGG